MPQDVSSLQVSFSDQASQSMDNLATAGEAAAASIEAVDTAVRRTTPTFTALQNQLYGTQQASNQVGKALGDFTSKSQAWVQQGQAMGLSASQLADGLMRLYQRFDNASDRAVNLGTSLESKLAPSVDATGLSFNAVGSAAQKAQEILAATLGTIGLGVDQVDALTASLNGVASAQDQAAAAARGYAQSAADIQSMFNPLATAAEQYAAIVGTIAEAQLHGVVNSRQATVAMAEATAAYGQAAQAAQRYQDQLSGVAANAIKAAEAAASAAQGQGIANSFAGVRDPLGGDDLAARTADIQAYGQALDGLRAKYDPLFAVSKQYEAELDAISEAEKVGAINATTAAQAREAATASFASLTSGTKSATQRSQENSAAMTGESIAFRQLGVQAIQAFSGIATGQPVMTTLIQQGHQIPDIMLGMGVSFKALASSAGSALSAIGGLPTLLTVGVAAAVAIATFSFASQQSALNSLSQQLRATRADYTDFATAATQASRAYAQSTPGVSTSDALTAAKAAGSVPTFDSTQLKAFLSASRDLAAELGETLPEAANKLADAMRNPEQVAQQWAETQSFGFTQELANQVKHLQDVGDKLGAYNLLLQSVQTASAGAANGSVSDLGKAWDDLWKSMDHSNTSGQGLFHTLGQMGSDALTGFLNFTSSVLQKLDELQTWFDQHTAVKNWFSGNIPALPTASQMDEAFANTGGGLAPGIPLNMGPAASSAAPGGAADVLSSPGLTSAQSLAVTQAAATAGVQAVQAELARQASANGVSPSLLSLAKNMSTLESSTGQFTTTGAVVTSSAGALGGMQVMPSNANGNDLTSLTGNVTASEQLLVRLYQKYSGDQVLVAMAYNWGEGNVDKYIAAGRTGAPQSVTAYANKATNGGVSYPPSSVAEMQGSVNTQLALSNSGDIAKQQQMSDAIAATNKALADNNALHAAGKESDQDYTDINTRLTQQLNQQTYEYQTARDPIVQLANSQKEQIALAQSGTGAARDIAQAMLTASDAARKQGDSQTAATDAALAGAREQALLTANLDQYVSSSDRVIQAQDDQTAKFLASGKSVTEYANAQKAAIDAEQYGPPGTDAYTDAVARLTAQYDKGSASAAAWANAQKVAQQSNDNSYLQAEIGTLGQDSDARQKVLDVMKAMQQLDATQGGHDDAVSQQFLHNIVVTDDLTAALNRQKNAMSEVANAATSAFDTVGNAIAQAFVQGQGAAVNWKNIMDSVIEQVIQELAKLAILNPILNSFSSSHSTTLSDVLGIGTVAGAAVAGGSGSSSGGSSSGGSSLLSDAQNFISLGKNGYSLITGNNPISGITDFLGITGGAAPAASSLAGGVSTVGATAGQTVSLAAADDFATASAGTAGSAAGASSGVLSGAASAAGFAAPIAVGAGLGIVGGTLIGSHESGDPRNASTGALGGAAIGAGIGLVAGPIGAAVGALIGGLVGGAGGGLIGHKLNPYSNVAVSTDAAGHIVTTGEVEQLADVTNTVNSLNTELNSINQLLDQFGVQAKGVANVGSHITGLPQTDDVAQGGMGQFSYSSSSDPTLNRILEDQRFTNASDLQTFLQDYQTFSQTIMPQLNAAGVQIADVNQLPLGDIMNNFGQIDWTGSDNILAQTLKGQTFSSLDKFNTFLQDYQTFTTQVLPAFQQAGVNLANTNNIPSGDILNNFGQLQWNADSTGNSNLEQAVDNKSFASIGDLQNVIAFYAQTVPQLLASVTPQESQFRQQIDAINNSFDAAITVAQQYGVAEDQLTDARNAAIASLMQQADYQVNADMLTNKANDETALASLTGNQGYAEDAALINFDNQATAQRLAMSKELTDFYGDSYSSTQDYADKMAAVDQTLSDQRLAIQKQYSDAALQAQQDADAQAAEAATEAAQEAAQAQQQAMDSATQSVTSVIQGLAQYAEGLQTSTSSPLSAQDQYNLAKGAFNTDSSEAAAGDYGAASRVQQDSQDFLSASSNLYDTAGTQYAADFQAVLGGLKGISQASTDSLTASALSLTVQTQTQTLVQSLADLGTKLDALIMVTNQRSTAPARSSS